MGEIDVPIWECLYNLQKWRKQISREKLLGVPPLPLHGAQFFSPQHIHFHVESRIISMDPSPISFTFTK